MQYILYCTVLPKIQKALKLQNDVPMHFTYSTECPVQYTFGFAHAHVCGEEAPPVCHILALPVWHTYGMPHTHCSRMLCAQSGYPALSAQFGTVPTALPPTPLPRGAMSDPSRFMYVQLTCGDARRFGCAPGRDRSRTQPFGGAPTLYQPGGFHGTAAGGRWEYAAPRASSFTASKYGNSTLKFPYLLVVSDDVTGACLLVKSRKADSDTVVDAFLKWIECFGVRSLANFLDRRERT